MSPIRFTPRPTPSEPGDSAHDTFNLSNSQHQLSPAQETGGYHLPESNNHNLPPHGVDLPTLNYTLNRPMQRPQDFTGWSVRPEHMFSPYTYGDPDINYPFSINNPQGVDEDPFAPRTTYPCDPRVIFNQNIDEASYDYPTDIQRQDQYALFGYGDPPEHHSFSRLSVSHSPAGEFDYTNSRSSSRYPSPSNHGLYSGTPNGGDEDVDGSGSLEQPEPDEISSDEPYAKLIYKALMEKPSHAMVLKDIYKWFETHTDKASNSQSKGWQNSIRHNLSMNGAFKKHEREPSSEDGKKYCEWVLEPSAIIEGVKSTTRYRKPTGPKNRNRSDPPAPIRQYSGRLGGQANRQQSQKRKFQDRLDRDMVLSQNGRSDRFESTGRFGMDRMSGRSYSPATPRTVMSQGVPRIGSSLMGKGDLSQCPPPPPKVEYEETLSPFFYSPAPPKDMGSGGLSDSLFSPTSEIMDGLPTPSDCIASLGEVAQVCMDDESPVFVDDEGKEMESTGPGHIPRMWDDWQYIESGGGGGGGGE